VFPLVPFTDNTYVPFVTDGAVSIVRVEVTKLLDIGVTGFVANVPVIPGGGLTSDRTTGELNPDTDVTFTVDGAKSPCTNAIPVALIMKSPVGTIGLTVSASVVLWDIVPLMLFTCIVYVPGMVDDATFSVRYVDAEPPDVGVIGFVVNEEVTPAGTVPPSDSVTGELKPLLDIT